ncbi:MAG: two-component sensor histidine kinase, partial [Legionella sp.]
RQWRLLLVYSIYRIITVFLFLGIYFYGNIFSVDTYIYFGILLIYFLSGLVFLYFCFSKNLNFTMQVMVSGTIDVVTITTMLSIIGNLQSGYGILLNVTIAALSILVPGRLAIFFAALASCLLLCGDLVQYLVNNQRDLGTFFYSGIYGAGFFGTALTAWYLANWIQISEALAQNRSYELAAMQKINEYIVDRLHSGIIYVDVGKEIKLINSAACSFFNSDKNNTPQYLHQLSRSLVDKFDNFLEKIKQNDTMAQTILEDPYLRVHFFSTSIADNPAVLIILEDMTFISQQAQQLKLASLGRFSASIAHELRNPLGAIAHAVQLLGEAGLNAEDERLKQMVINNCDRMNGVIKNVLQLSRRQKSQPQIIEIEPFLKQFKENFLHQNNCEFKLKYSKSRPLSIVFDKSQLEQILIILCDNALQHAADAEGKVTITLSVKSGDKNVLVVSDLGPGIPAEHRDDIFEPFFTTLRTGTGMGLFIARDLCEINQARLNWVDSPKGSSFAITLNTSDELLI